MRSTTHHCRPRNMSLPSHGGETPANYPHATYGTPLREWKNLGLLGLSEDDRASPIIIFFLIICLWVYLSSFPSTFLSGYIYKYLPVYLSVLLLPFFTHFLHNLFVYFPYISLYTNMPLFTFMFICLFIHSVVCPRES